MKVVRTRDFAGLTVTERDGAKQPFVGPRGDMVMLDLEPVGNYVAVRPSGTEPKVKFYMFAYDPPGAADLPAAKAAQAARLAAMEADLKTFALGG
jgi:phosphoglucomutase/phosphomannomutase